MDLLLTLNEIISVNQLVQSPGTYCTQQMVAIITIMSMVALKIFTYSLLSIRINSMQD